MHETNLPSNQETVDNSRTHKKYGEIALYPHGEIPVENLRFADDLDIPNNIRVGEN